MSMNIDATGQLKYDNLQERLESFLNGLDGEVVSVLPNVTQYFLCYGAKVNYILVVEKVK